MEVCSAGNSDHNRLAYWRYVNPKIERTRDGLAVKQQLHPTPRNLPLRIQVLAVIGPLWRAGLIRGRLAIHDEHGRLLPFGIVPDVRIVVAVRTERDCARVPVGVARRTRFAVEYEPDERGGDRISHCHITEVIHMLIVGSETQHAVHTGKRATQRFGAADKLFAIHHHNILIASAGTVGIAVSLRAENNTVGALVQYLIELRPGNAIVIDNDTATVVFYSRDVNAVGTDFEFRALLERC